jgi:excisionase family DNA binding protein
MTDLTTDSRLTWTVEEAADLLGISRPSAYAAVNNADIPSIRVGRRLLVPKAALEKLLAEVKA